VWTKLVTLPELRAMDEDQIVLTVNELLVPTPIPNAHLDAGAIAAAQFYMAELDRRERRKADDERDATETNRWRVDLRYERWIVILIVAEIILAIGLAVWGDRRQTEDIQKQLKAFGETQKVLSHLQDSSQATADTMKELKSATEGMNTALQKQLMLFYEVSVNVIIDPTTKEIWLINNGRTNVVIWGTKFGEGAAYITKDGRTVAPAASIRFSGMDIYNALIARSPKPQVGFAPFELYIKNEKQEQFIESGDIGIHWEGDNAKVFAQTNSVIPSHWNQASSPAPSARP
jgi:hypothetical protein